MPSDLRHQTAVDPVPRHEVHLAAEPDLKVLSQICDLEADGIAEFNQNI